METILRILFPALEPSTSASIVVLTLATAVALALVIGVARRRHSYWWLPMAILAVAFSATALASWLGVRMFAAVFKDVATNGGGIGAISAGIWKSVQLPLTAAWIGLITVLIAAIFLRRFPDDRRAASGRSHPAAFGLLMTAGLTTGLAPLLAFRTAVVVVLRAITPGTAIPAATVLEHLLAYEVFSASYFVVVVGILVAITRLARSAPASAPVSFMMTIALLLVIAVSAFSAASFRATSIHFDQVARCGRVASIGR